MKINFNKNDLNENDIQMIFEIYVLIKNMFLLLVILITNINDIENENK